MTKIIYLTRNKYCINNKYIYLGLFNNEREAAKAYDNAALRYYGGFANLNDKKRQEENY